MKITQKLLGKGIFATLFLMAPVLGIAQTDPSCDPLCNCRADGSLCPIDSSVWVLLLFGALYGTFLIFKAKASRKQPGEISNS